MLGVYMISKQQSRPCRPGCIWFDGKALVLIRINGWYLGIQMEVSLPVTGLSRLSPSGGTGDGGISRNVVGQASLGRGTVLAYSTTDSTISRPLSIFLNASFVKKLNHKLKFSPGQGVWHLLSTRPDKIIGAAALSGYYSLPGRAKTFASRFDSRYDSLCTLSNVELCRLANKSMR